MTRPVLRAALPDQRQLPLGFAAHERLVGAGPGCVVVEHHLAALVDGADRELRIARRAELAHQHHIQFAVQRVGDHAPHRHGAARYRQHHGPRGAVADQSGGQLPRGVVAIVERQYDHDSAPQAACRLGDTIPH